MRIQKREYEKKERETKTPFPYCNSGFDDYLSMISNK